MQRSYDMKIGIVGAGHVGKCMIDLFKNHNPSVYDLYQDIGSIEEINQCDVAFVCVPTPMAEDGSCDTSEVDKVLSWLTTDVIVIRSTVPVGYTERAIQKTQRSIVFQPEYYGETYAHPYADLSHRKWIVLGGRACDTEKALEAYKMVYTSELQVVLVSSEEAEFAKYMENSFLALKVTFCNEMYDIAKSLGVSYDRAREAWLADARIGRSHTFVYENDRGYGGSCLPKDISAIAHQGKAAGSDTLLLDAVIQKNKQYRSE